VGAVAVAERATSGSRVACAELFAKLDDEMGALVSILQVAQVGLRDIAVEWRSERRVVEIVDARRHEAGRRTLQDALEGVGRTFALLRGMMAAAVLDEGTSYAEIETLTGLRRQTWADLVAKARHALERS